MRVVLLLAVAVLLAPAALAGTAPRISADRTGGVTVRGVGFHAHERVRVKVSARTTSAKWVVAGATGRFVARFALLRIAPCQAWSVTARGAQSGTAGWVARPECAQP